MYYELYLPECYITKLKWAIPDCYKTELDCFTPDCYKSYITKLKLNFRHMIIIQFKFVHKFKA